MQYSYIYILFICTSRSIVLLCLKMKHFLLLKFNHEGLLEVPPGSLRIHKTINS